MKQTLSLFLSMAFIAMTAPASFAAINMYSAILTGAAEAPPNASPATGSATLTIDTVLNTMRVQAVYSGLTGNATAAHLHGPTAVPFTGTAGVMSTTPSFPGFPTGVTSGVYDLTFDLTQAASYNAAFVTSQGGIANARSALLNGLNNGTVYFNLHSAAFPGGEIRGFLTPSAIPEPSGLMVLAGAVAAASFVRRRGLAIAG